MTSLAGTGPLLRLAWRRDRWIILASVLALVAAASGSMVATLDLYPTDAEAAAGAGFDNPSLTALYGPLLRHRGRHQHPQNGHDGQPLHGVPRLRDRATTHHEAEDGRFELIAAGSWVAVLRWPPPSPSRR